MKRRLSRGQATVEFALVFGAVLLPVTLMLISSAQLLWVWHSVSELTRNGARYAATHCWQNGAQNVINYMRANVPPTFDHDRFSEGEADIGVEYFSRDPESGALTEFSCDGGDCSTMCIPDTVTVRVTNYEFRGLAGYLGLPPITIPAFETSLPMESAGCDPEQATCEP
jgi:hypothetical protein